jgi:hypothetical protein
MNPGVPFQSASGGRDCRQRRRAAEKYGRDSIYRQFPARHCSLPVLTTAQPAAFSRLLLVTWQSMSREKINAPSAMFLPLNEFFRCDCLNHPLIREKKLMLITRRNFLATTASVSAGLWLAARGVAETPATAELAADFAPFGEFKVKYFGRFSELPVGSVKPAGWMKGWLDRQPQGLTGHPENLGYPYDTCMYAGKIPPPTVRHGENWWPYEQSGYFLDGVVRLSLHRDNPPPKSSRPQA